MRRRRSSHPLARLIPVSCTAILRTRSEMTSKVSLSSSLALSWQQQKHQNFIILNVLHDVNESTSSCLRSLGLDISISKRTIFLCIFFYVKLS